MKCDDDGIYKHFIIDNTCITYGQIYGDERECSGPSITYTDVKQEYTGPRYLQASCQTRM